MPDTIKSVPLADTVAEHIEKLIFEGVLRPGEKLAAERDLANALGVSRPSLRDALAQLEKKNLVVTGKTGTVVASFLAPLSDPLAVLFCNDTRATSDYFEYRRLVEAHAARQAATRATDIDHKAIKACIDRMKKAHRSDDPTEEADADADLHLLIYEAAHNVVVLHVMRVFSDMLRKSIFYSRDQLYRRPGVREVLLKQHVAIADAVIARDGTSAEKAASNHIEYTAHAVDEIARDQQRLVSSLRRIERKDLLANG